MSHAMGIVGPVPGRNLASSSAVCMAVGGMSVAAPKPTMVPMRLGGKYRTHPTRTRRSPVRYRLVVPFESLGARLPWHPELVLHSLSASVAGFPRLGVHHVLPLVVGLLLLSACNEAPREGLASPSATSDLAEEIFGPLSEPCSDAASTASQVPAAEDNDAEFEAMLEVCAGPGELFAAVQNYPNVLGVVTLQEFETVLATKCDQQAWAACPASETSASPGPASSATPERVNPGPLCLADAAKASQNDIADVTDPLIVDMLTTCSNLAEFAEALRVRHVFPDSLISTDQVVDDVIAQLLCDEPENYGTPVCLSRG